MHHISVTYVGRKPIDWDPAKASAEDAAAKSPTTPDPRIVAMVQAAFDRTDNNKHLPATERAERITPYVALRALFLDPDTNLIGRLVTRLQNRPNSFIGFIISVMATDIATMMDRWNPEPDVPQDAADRRAQKLVPRRYGNRCVLTGMAKPLGAHILSVEADQYDIYRQLQISWNYPDLEGLVVNGREQENILPLTHTLQAFWDQFYFGLRPIVHPQDPQHRLYLQLVWLRDPDGGRIDNDWQHSCFGGGCDFRRATDEETAEFPALKNGDVYELVTDDPAACPLPSMPFLQIRYGANRMMAGLQAASSLKTIFSGDPPPDSDGDAAGTQDLDEVDVPPAWRSTLEAALDNGVLDEQAAVRWGRGLARAARDRQARRKRYLTWLERRLQGEDEEDYEEDEEEEDL